VQLSQGVGGSGWPAPRCANLSRITSAVLARWPEHEAFLTLRFASDGADQLGACERVAELVWRLVEAELDEAVDSYRWMCEAFLAEEEFFRRNGRYRHSSLREVERAVYADPRFMRRYLRGLLLSQVLWRNHAGVLDCYVREFLAQHGRRRRLLEVGPGHGLLLALAADAGVAELSGWDISQSSIDCAADNLARLGVGPVRLARRDVQAPLGPAAAEDAFDLVVASELLEHVERPADVLRSLARLARPDGLLFLNVPVNSPAPDHIYLWRSPEELFDFVAGCGVRLVSTRTIPLTGYTEERARSRGYTISCVVVGQPNAVS
jgi:2-polyprenyl-3-methyl-5-hydroxy-6-metoxy-1,4-benzoquinol methylase